MISATILSPEACNLSLWTAAPNVPGDLCTTDREVSRQWTLMGRYGFRHVVSGIITFDAFRFCDHILGPGTLDDVYGGITICRYTRSPAAILNHGLAPLPPADLHFAHRINTPSVRNV